MFTKQKILAIVFFSFLLWAPVLVEARGLVPCGGYKADGTREAPCTVVDMFYLVARVTNWLIMMAGVYATFQIIGAGFWLTTTQGNEEAITKRKEAIMQAVIGMILVLMAFLFVNTAVNGLLRSKCKVDLRSPLTYLSIDPNYNDCRK